MTCIRVVRRSGYRIQVGRGARFSASIQTRAWGSPSFLYKGYCVSYLGIKRLGRGVDHPPLQRPRLKRQKHTSFPLLGIHGLLQSELYIFRFEFLTRTHSILTRGDGFVVFPGKSWDSTSTWAMTASSVLFSNSLLTYHPTVRCHKTCTAETAEIHGVSKKPCANFKTSPHKNKDRR